MKRILWVPDTHRPYHDKRAWRLMLKAATVFAPDILVIGGDFADCYSVSSHPKDPSREANLKAEIEDVNVGLDELDRLNAKRKVYIEGNHEYRLARYLEDKAPELFGMVTVPDILRLKSRKWEFVPYKSDIQIGKIYATHDCGKAGPGAVPDAIRTYQHSIVINHTHRISYEVQGNAAGVAHVGASFGWLGDAKSADYMFRVKAARDWALGFGIGYLNPSSGFVYLMPVPIVAYTCVINGVLYRG